MKFAILGLILLGLTACMTIDTNISNSSKTIAIQKQYPIEINSLKKGLRIYFQPKSSHISTEYLPVLSVAAQLLQANKNFILQIDGYTDNSGSLTSNNKISLIRANIIKNLLINEYNVNPEQLIVSAFGSTKPIADNKTAEGKAKNRRVEITLKIQ